MVTLTPSAIRPWYRDRWLVWVGLLGALTACVQGGQLLPRSALGATSWLVLTGFEVTEAVLCWRIAGMPELGRQFRRFWRVLAAAPALFAAGSAAQFGLAVRDPLDPTVITGGPTQVTLVGTGSVFLVAAILTSPLGLTTQRERRRFWLDAATVLLFVALIAWQLADPVASFGRSLPGTSLVNAVIGPAAFVMVAFGVLKILLGGQAPFTRAAGSFGLLAALLQSVNTGFAETLVAHGHAPWKLGIGMATDLVFIAGLRVQRRQLLGAGGRQVRDGRRRPHSRLPYLALAASYGMLVLVLNQRPLSVDELVALGCALGGSGLVVLRQLAAFADNDDLLAERDALAERLRHLAYHDALTGLANRALFLDRLTEALAGPRTEVRVGDPDSETGPTVMIIDLDGFKPVNDRYGHRTGDDLLRVVADRVCQSVRRADTVARLGGDEFAVLLLEAPEEGLPTVVRRVAAAIAEPVEFQQGTVTVRASIGTATATGADEDVTALLHRADLQMYAVKQSARRASAR